MWWGIGLLVNAAIEDGKDERALIHLVRERTRRSEKCVRDAMKFAQEPIENLGNNATWERVRDSIQR